MTTVEKSTKKVKQYLLHPAYVPGFETSRANFSDYAIACRDDITWSEKRESRLQSFNPSFSCSPDDIPFGQRFLEAGSSSEKLFRCGDIWERYTFYDEEMNRKRFAYGYSRGKKLDDAAHDAMMQAFNEYRVQKFLEEFTEEFPGDETDVSPKETRPMTDEEKEQERQRRKRRQKKQVQRYVNLNRLHYMYTFTFALEQKENVRGLRFILPEEHQRDRGGVEKVWNTRLTYIRRKLQEQGREFKFLKVLEKHAGKKTDPRKRGTYHIHLATDKPINKDELQKLWGYGVVWVDNFNKSKKQMNGKTVNVEREGIVNDPGRYMSKYMEKDFDDAENHGYRRAYSPSQNLKTPKSDRNEEMNQNMIDTPRLGFQKEELDPLLWEKICQLASAEEVKTFENTYPVEYIARDETGEERTVKMFVKYEYFNFRMLYPNVSKVKRKT